MNYKVLYRKYRPNDFENIIGQEYIIKTLKNSIISNNISHAYIFSGPRGTGKTSTAKVFAKAINCLNPKDGSPCGECDFCENAIGNPDIIEMDAASNNGVDEIREIIDNIKLTPTSGKYKVYIIDEVHMLTSSAFNALLLTLEEPPAHIVFILATTNIENVPITILSRCQRFDFQKISVENLMKSLSNVCQKENISIDEAALKEIAFISEGGMRDALSLLDQLAKNNEKITVDLIEKEIKVISESGINELIELIEDNNLEEFLNIIHSYETRSVDYKTLIKRLINSMSKRARNIKLSGKIKRLSFIDYKNAIIALSECLAKINVNINPFILIEITLMEYFDVNAVSNLDSNTNTKENTSKQFSVKAKENLFINNNIIDIRINNCLAEANKQLLENLKDSINKIKSLVDGKIKAILMDSNVVASSDKYAIFSTIDDKNANIGNSLLKEIEYELSKELNSKYKIIFISESRWKSEKEKYINSIKNGKKYSFVEEVENNETKAEENIVNDIFDKSKVEII